MHPEITKEYLLNVCRKAVEEDHADGVILGCLSMAGYGEEIEKTLPVKAFNSAFIAMAYTEMIVRIGLRHISVVYPPFTNISNVEL